MLKFKISKISKNFSLTIKDLTIEEKLDLLKEIKKSFQGGEYLAKLIFFKKNKIVVKLPLRFYLLGGKAFKDTHPFLNKIPPHFFKKIKNFNKWFVKQVE